MFQCSRVVLFPGLLPALLLLGLAGCAKDKDEQQREVDASTDVAVELDTAKSDVSPLLLDTKADPEIHAEAGPDVAPLPLDAKADSVHLPDAGAQPDAGVDVRSAVDLARADAAGVGIDGTPSLDTNHPIDWAAAVDTRIVCHMPEHSTNCSEVEYFECGFTPKCEDGVLSISWHQHACDGSSWVRSYSCTYTCPKGCNPNGIPWASSGTQLVAEACNP